MQLPDIIKAAGVGDKMKKEWRRAESGRGKTENGDGDKKRKGWFSRWRYGRSRCAGFAGDIQGTEASRGVRKQLNKQGLGGSGQNALEKMKEIEKQILNKGFKNET
jgi:hypothetical protein